MSCTSWGKYPRIACKKHLFESKSALKVLLNHESELIPCGNRRSYGDSALNNNIVDVRPHDYFLDFDEETGLLHIQAGVLLADILETFVPRGWFPKVTPGTKLITVGGAIASDVHGKNHHNEGCFSDCLEEFTIMFPDGQIVTCSLNSYPGLFKATCGGMGLTGIILDAKIYLKKINSIHIEQITIKTRNLKETFDAFEKFRSKPYSVAWIDCLAKGSEIGKCLLMVGDFMDDGNLGYRTKKLINIPFNFPNFVINRLTIKAFNWLYYNKVKERVSKQKVTIDSFFYPLDAIGNWNNIYGKNGFTQYQFVLPIERSYEGLEEILKVISNSGKGSFLAVLKLFGKANDNYLSFPLEGYTLALDFKIESGLFDLLDEIDEIVIKYQGRIYLTKDVRVSKETFEKGYPKIESFRQFRNQIPMGSKLQSLQSKRVGI
jgi:decaprenylphospho-beta-D-ribofuranose 2-oxidase